MSSPTGQHKRVCIIGGGVSGLTSIKSCLEEGLRPVCFEQHDHVGGQWHFSENMETGRNDSLCRMFSAVVTNTSKKMTEFSDFPMPKDFPTFIPARKITSYIQDYAEHFDLKKYVQYGMRVDDVSKADDFSQSGQWKVTYTHVKEISHQKTEIFDCVMVCNGIFNEQNRPHYPGLEMFQGEVTHGGNYFHCDPYKDKNVLVVGSSFSAADIAVDLSRMAKNTYISTRRGFWIMPRLPDGQDPWDMTLFSRPLINWLPWALRTRAWGNVLKERFNYQKFDVNPHKRFLSQSLCITDELQNKLLYGQVKAKPSISKFTSSGVTFTDGTSIEDLDAVIFATGYRLKCAFIKDTQVLPENSAEMEMYKHIFPVNIKHQTLVCINYLRVLGSVLPTSELQARVAARVFSGNLKLPSASHMKRDVAEKKSEIINQWGNCTVPKEFVYFYYEELAQLLGVKPQTWKLLVTNPSLVKKLMFGPVTPAQYRLHGPHANFDVAAQSILDI
ncbi:dimethylaniline monooxygenase [N-oxide-forming] 2 [Lingula anatina]|uniref:Flavin-containing monooxygenase n=1 Tax=Lingula anatina TaxID=7574 RepID=A0A1S3HS48_LINAN|nr:dimethylaniline monooxygenase [N-oxide-forming] 2 [Lingula anatina]|eukprot:XP_013388858.1 dimethylaniline monooxygenase [N-oxide-forming] 2 [Lingula anatina]